MEKIILDLISTEQKKGMDIYQKARIATAEMAFEAAEKAYKKVVLERLLELKLEKTARYYLDDSQKEVNRLKKAIDQPLEDVAEDIICDEYLDDGEDWDIPNDVEDWAMERAKEEIEDRRHSLRIQSSDLERRKNKYEAATKEVAEATNKVHSAIKALETRAKEYYEVVDAVQAEQLQRAEG